MLSANESGAMSAFGGLGDDALGLHASPESAAGGGRGRGGRGLQEEHWGAHAKKNSANSPRKQVKSRRAKGPGQEPGGLPREGV